MSDKRQQNQLELAFTEMSRSEAPRDSAEGIESLMAKRNDESSAGSEPLMEAVCGRKNCQQALARVKSNKGSAGIDGMTVEQLPDYKRAIEIDPNYALAYTGLAVAHISFPISADVQPSHSFPQAKAAALKALSLDETLADAHAYLAFVKFWFDWDWSGADVELKRALDLNPNSAEAHRGYAILLSSLRKFDEAVIHGRHARQLDPLALITRANEAMFLYYAGHLDQAEERLKSTLELEPNFWVALLMLGKVYLQQGKHDLAIEVLSKARDFCGGSSQPLAMLGFVYALMDDHSRARLLLQELESLAAKRYVPPYNFALIFYGLNDLAKVFEWLEHAYEAHDVLLSAFINSEPFWETLRSDARFRSVLKRMNLSR